MPGTVSPEGSDLRRGAELRAPDGRSLPLVSARLRVTAGGGLARLVLEQTFENPYDDTLRVTYKMPLPVDGAVSGYTFRIGTRTITGKVDRKESARERFEEAIARGHTAAILEQDKADIFTQEIGNIPPRATIVAEITVDQRLAWTTEGQWELRFPTVIGPRYLGAHLSEAERRASHVELADGGVRGRAHLVLRVTDALAADTGVTSPSHAVTAGADGVVELTDPHGARLDRDLVVRWTVTAPTIGLHLQVARPASGSAHARQAYALLTIVPPAPDARHAALPRDLIVLLDTSGSMDGAPLEQGKRVVASLVDSLTAQDRLEIVEFSMRPNAWSKAPVPATESEKAKAIAWVMSRQASGGTEMQSAIVEALRGLRAGAQRQVVLVTDGYVGGEEQIVTLLHESLPASCRMHVVGVGSAVNRNLAASLARAGRGAEVLVGPDEDAERGARRIIEKTRAPVLTDLVLGGDAIVEHAPEHVPDVFAGSPVLAALAVRPQGGEIVVRGQLARGAWEQRIAVPPCEPGEGSQAITKLFARERVADLEMRWSIGREVQLVDRDIESLGMVFQIATRRTSWLAIDDDRSVEPARGVRHEEIPQEVPYGTSFVSFGGPPPPLMRAMPMAMAQAPAGAAMAKGAAFGSLRASRPALGAPPVPAPRSAPLPPPAASYGGGPGSVSDDDDDATSSRMRAPTTSRRRPTEPVLGEGAQGREAETLPPPPAPEAAPSPSPEPQVSAPADPAKKAKKAKAVRVPPEPVPAPRGRRWQLLLAVAVVVLALLAALLRLLLH